MVYVDKNPLVTLATLLQKSWESDQQLFGALFDLLLSAVSFDCATLFLKDPASGKLEHKYQIGDSVVDLIRDVSFDNGPGLSGWIANQREPVILSSLRKSRPGQANLFNSFVSLPLWAGERLLGVMNLGHSREGVYREEDLEKFVLIANQFSIAAEQLFLRKKLQARNQELQDSLEKLQQTQAELVESERMAAIGEITVTVNHEINNPLTSIIGNAELLQLKLDKQINGKSAVKDHLEIILAQAYRIRSITYQLKKIETSLSDDYCDDIQMTRLAE
ncbi:MAG: GAF domain-containing protein [Candidatus Marinimicrobia bacterium]|nr:GAF domain-containing protein [Candidatus Neomarinimicrobiota bacterium]MCF7841135.1 GAF domain-containing protein [Candidatus Neomarinimicrobiota bacterium]MCF7902395.1 GAF domain-containing protein [Candidatus Neomarinimicrobiota bacterium]